MSGYDEKALVQYGEKNGCLLEAWAVAASLAKPGLFYGTSDRPTQHAFADPRGPVFCQTRAYLAWLRQHHKSRVHWCRSHGLDIGCLSSMHQHVTDAVARLPRPSPRQEQALTALHRHVIRTSPAEAFCLYSGSPRLGFCSLSPGGATTFTPTASQSRCGLPTAHVLRMGSSGQSQLVYLSEEDSDWFRQKHPEIATWIKQWPGVTSFSESLLHLVNTGKIPSHFWRAVLSQDAFTLQNTLRDIERDMKKHYGRVIHILPAESGTPAVYDATGNAPSTGQSLMRLLQGAYVSIPPSARDSDTTIVPYTGDDGQALSYLTMSRGLRVEDMTSYDPGANELCTEGTMVSRLVTMSAERWDMSRLLHACAMVDLAKTNQLDLKQISLTWLPRHTKSDNPNVFHKEPVAVMNIVHSECEASHVKNMINFYYSQTQLALSPQCQLPGPVTSSCGTVVSLTILTRRVDFITVKTPSWSAARNIANMEVMKCTDGSRMYTIRNVDSMKTNAQLKAHYARIFNVSEAEVKIQTSCHLNTNFNIRPVIHETGAQIKTLSELSYSYRFENLSDCMKRMHIYFYSKQSGQRFMDRVRKLIAAKDYSSLNVMFGIYNVLQTVWPYGKPRGLWRWDVAPEVWPAVEGGVRELQTELWERELAVELTMERLNDGGKVLTLEARTDGDSHGKAVAGTLNNVLKPLVLTAGKEKMTLWKSALGKELLATLNQECGCTAILNTDKGAMDVFGSRTAQERLKSRGKEAMDMYPGYWSDLEVNTSVPQLSRVARQCGAVTAIRTGSVISVCVRDLNRSTEVYENLQNALRYTTCKGACVVCFCDVTEGVNLRCCGQSVCQQCLRQHVHHAITNGLLPITCVHCGERLHLEDVGLGRRDVTEEQLGHHVMQHLLKTQPKEYRSCVRAGCPAVYKTGDYVVRTGFPSCGACRTLYCPSCHVSAEEHGPVACAVRDVRQRADPELRAWLERDPQAHKICPNCEHGVEKLYGCSQVYCTQCRRYMCWDCVVSFTDLQEMDFHYNNHSHGLDDYD